MTTSGSKRRKPYEWGPTRGSTSTSSGCGDYLSGAVVGAEGPRTSALAPTRASVAGAVTRQVILDAFWALDDEQSTG